MSEAAAKGRPAHDRPVPPKRTAEDRVARSSRAPAAATAGSGTTAAAAPSGEPDSTAPTPSTAAPRTAVPATGTSTSTSRPGGGLAGATFYGPNRGAAAAAAQPGTTPADATLLADLARVPTAIWLGQWSGDVTATVRGVLADARQSGAVPVFVAYDIPGRDCGGHSSGGAGSPAEYARWIRGIADGIGTGEAVVIVEPDALAQLCGDSSERLAMLRTAVGLLADSAGTHVYLDAGHADWVDAATMAERLRSAGVAQTDGFALNVSNFGTTAGNVAYGQRLSSLLGGAHFVVDTSRNGNGPGSDWCNPSGRALGERPTTATGSPLVDAFLWVKTPGESDGACNGGPAAGVFWPSYALGLMRG